MPCSANLVCIHPEVVDHIWPQGKEFIKRACNRTKLLSFEQLQIDVLAGRALLWLVHNDKVEGAVVTQIVGTDEGRVCVIIAAGGKPFFHLVEKIEHYAKQQDCVKTRIVGRKGWQRVLDGYKQKYVIMDKVI